MNEVNYELRKPFDYASKGETQTANFVTLHEPTYHNMQGVVIIKQAIMRAVLSASSLADNAAASEQAKQAEPSALSGADIMLMLYQWDGDLNKVLLACYEIFKNGGALIDGEVKMTQPLLERIDPKDIEGMIGSYIASFLAASLMDGE